MISDHYNKTADILRLQFVVESGESGESGQTTDMREFPGYLFDIPCNLQPLSGDINRDINAGFGKDFLLFCDLEDIEETDRVIIDNKEYRITGLKTFTMSGNPHMELIIRIFES